MSYHQIKGFSTRLHLFMLAACVLLLVFLVSGARLFHYSGWRTPAAASIFLLPISALPGVLWHDRRQYEKRNAALTLPWIVLLVLTIPYIAALSGRFRFPLRDTLFIKLDDAAGFNVPAIVAWSAKYSVWTAVLDRSYSHLAHLLLVAMLVPALAGKRRAAEQFVLANTIAFLIALPMFTFLPAIGPWAGFHFDGNMSQKACEASIVALRSGTENATVLAIICFPSFHAIWAILAAVALWSVAPLRIPASLLAFLVVVSTVTTGWHYVADVLVGIAIAGISLLCAEPFLGRQSR